MGVLKFSSTETSKFPQPLSTGVSSFAEYQSSEVLKQAKSRLYTYYDNLARVSEARIGSARSGSARLSLARLGAARLGSVRLGAARLGWAGLGWHRVEGTGQCETPGPKYQSTGSSPERRNRALSESTKVLIRATGSRIETGVLKRTGSESTEASELYICINICLSPIRG